MTRVGFTLIGGGRGTGVYNYLLNLLSVLRRYQAARVTPVLFLGDDLTEEVVAPCAAVPGLEIVRHPAFALRRKSAALAEALALGADTASRAVFVAHGIDVLFESAQFHGWRLPFSVIAWIPDFQHRHLPHMFSRWGLVRREIGFRAQMIAGRTIMLSSEDARQDCERFYPSSVGRTRVVRFAVLPETPLPLEAARATAERYGLPERFFYVPNQFSKHKNHLLVLEALAVLRMSRPDIVIAASGKPVDERDPRHFPEVENRVRELRLEKQFRILGMLPFADVRALMQASLALLNPSLFEGWSTPVEEARGLGVPLLLSDLDVHREQAAEDATYFDRYSAQALASTLKRFQPLSPDERAVRIARGRASAAERVRHFAAEFALLVTDCTAGQALR